MFNLFLNLENFLKDGFYQINLNASKYDKGEGEGAGEFHFKWEKIHTHNFFSILFSQKPTQKYYLMNVFNTFYESVSRYFFDV